MRVQHSLQLVALLLLIHVLGEGQSLVRRQYRSRNGRSNFQLSRSGKFVTVMVVVSGDWPLCLTADSFPRAILFLNTHTLYEQLLIRKHICSLCGVLILLLLNNYLPYHRLTNLHVKLPAHRVHSLRLSVCLSYCISDKTARKT